MRPRFPDCQEARAVQQSSHPPTQPRLRSRRALAPSRERRWRDTGVPVPRTGGACFGPLGRWEPARLNLSRRRAIDPAKVKAIRAARRTGKKCARRGGAVWCRCRYGRAAGRLSHSQEHPPRPADPAVHARADLARVLTAAEVPLIDAEKLFRPPGPAQSWAAPNLSELGRIVTIGSAWGPRIPPEIFIEHLSASASPGA